MTTTFRPGDWVSIDKPPLTATSDTDATQTVLSAYNTLMPRNLRPFRVKAASNHSLAIDEDGIYKVVFTDHAIGATPIKHPVITDSYFSLGQQCKKDPEARTRSAQCELNTAKAGEARQGSAAPNHTVKKLSDIST